MEFDTLSNCSDVSDDVRSNASVLSGLSNYQDEFENLRQLVNPLKYPSATLGQRSTPPSKQEPHTNPQCEDHLKNLSYQLQNSQKLNEKYKNDLYNLEKNIELKYFGKIEDLLGKNKRLQVELEEANRQIERLITNFPTKHSTVSKSDKNFLYLEQRYHELTLQNSSLQYETFQSKSHQGQCDAENKHLKIQLNELKIDLNAKNVCVQELKKQITQQHIEIQSLLKDKFDRVELLNQVTSELNHLKKTHDWYIEQLHLSQKNKRALSNEVEKYKSLSFSNDEKIECLQIDLSRWKNKCESLQLEVLKERGKFNKHIENVNTQKALTKNDADLKSVEDEVNIDSSISNYYEGIIEDLTNEIKNIKESIHEQELTYKKITNENTELLSRCITLQKSNQQSELLVEELESCNKRTLLELNLTRDKEKNASNELTALKNKIFSLEKELSVKNREKDLVENTIKTIRDQFTILKNKYEQLKNDILEKNKKILQLENEKQKLFMDNNWNICELEKMKEQDALISKLKYDITCYEQKTMDYIKKTKNMEDKLYEQKVTYQHLIEEKQSIINNNLLEMQKYEAVIADYKMMVTNYENQLNTLQAHLKGKEQDITELNDNINILKQEINKKDIRIREIQNNCSILEQRLKVINDQGDKVLFSGQKNCSINGSHVSKSSVLEIIKHLNIYNIENNKKIEDNELLETLLQQFQNKSVQGTTEENIEKSNVLKVKKLKGEMSRKLVTLNNRVQILFKKNEEIYKVLHSLPSSNESSSICHENRKLQELKVLFEVKELELREKQKRYETNNRTLLRKVKEHMKGRNASEKHNKYLQELYNTLSDDHNSLKLNLYSKECEIESLKKLVENYISINSKLKQSVLKVEEKAKNNLKCHNCLDFFAVNKRLEHVKEMENEKLEFQAALLKKEAIIENLQIQYQDVLGNNACLNTEKHNYIIKIENLLDEKSMLSNKVITLEKEVKDKQIYADKLSALLKSEEENCTKSENESSRLKTLLDEQDNKLKYLSSEVTILESSLQNKSEDLILLERKMSTIENNGLKKYQDSQNTIISLRNQLHALVMEITSINSEKYFLQRLCADLKLALKTHVNHNKMLKEQLENMPREQQSFSSLPNIFPEIDQNKYDEDYVNQLLQQNRAPLQDKPLTEIQGCLDTLRKEILTLQDQIAKKNQKISHS